MKKASITQTKNQLSALLDRVRHGETVLIMDRGRPVARLEPALQEGEGNEAGRLARLERAGILRRAISPARSRLLLEPPPKSKKGASILQALLAEREQGR
ncbi:MAG: type II toxin-antitoxin system prevent-host-death family antitoxin [Sulfuricaulis sp.]|uniref:type II toxin-antitoxin system Phd/YefM family antitoxin n=1 Tax=Sulfuricaulis sp. TaxID=2003553 RepID=UPI0025D3D43A|nr:type II toxin-antitoxin system prevent-host-death family antitoxin [Sulfuricaulis sp.]MCR4347997.1 type II toxin-antitoxin system prevent-host-death family antitoxin [Sulfuricaulis sp.]